MLRLNVSVPTLLLMCFLCLTIGCSDECTCPDRTPLSAGGKHIWSKRFGDAEYQYSRAVAIDASGNIIVAGVFGGTIDFGGGPLTSEGSQDIFIAKFGSDGTYIWSESFGNSSSEEVRAVAVDASGNVILTGSFSGTVDFGGGALTSEGAHNIFAAKYDSDGTHLWSKRFGNGDLQSAWAVAVDASEDVILTGDFSGTVDFGGGLLTSAGDMDIFVAKFKADGAHLWSKRFGDSNLQSSTSVAVDVLGNMIVAGYFGGTVDFGDGALTSAGEMDIFVAKFGSNGASLWSKSFGDSAFQYAEGVAADASGNVIVTGCFNGIADFGGGELTSAGDMDIYVAKFRADGAHLWSKRFGDVASQCAYAVVVDASEDVIIAGEHNGTVDFGGGALTSAGGLDIFVAKFGFDGAPLWSKRFGDGSYQACRSVAADVSRNVVIAGWFLGIVDFGSGALASAGDYDAYVAKFGR